jgi:hypothetical protein
MDNLALALGALAGLVQLAGYWQYHWAMSHDEHKPNTASWFMWGVGGVTELIVYMALVEDRAKEILPAVCAVVVVITFLRVWWREGVLRLDRWDWTVVLIDSAVVAFWFLTKNPYAANVFLGIDMILSFLPILKSTRKDPCSENPVPWRTWTIAYSVLTLVVILQWQNAWELIYPVIYLVLHAAVWQLSARTARAAVSHL